MRYLKFVLEAFILYVFYGLCAALPPETASNLGGFLGRSIGPGRKFTNRARENIKNAMPEKTPEQVEAIILEMWDNMGRVLAEYPHLEKIASSRITIHGGDILERILGLRNGGVFFGAHQGNWEINCPALLVKYNVAPRLTYRALNNPFADYLLERARTLGGRIPTSPKTRSSAKELMNTLREKHFIGILIDQKYNEGVETRFFGRPAMTNPVAVMLAQKFNAPLIPVRNVRIGPARFELTVYEPLNPVNDGGSSISQEHLVQQTQDIIESWVRENPGQWLWLHRRWKSS